MIEVEGFPAMEVPPGRSFFTKGDLFDHFYFLEEGRAAVTVGQVRVEVAAPIFLGDYELTIEMEYRVSSIKSVTRCRIRTLPVSAYPPVGQYHSAIASAFLKFSLKAKVLVYWLKKLFVVGEHKRNDQVACEQALGVVLRGEFRLNSNIAIVRMREPTLELLRRFEICSIGEQELFEESLVCESHRGTTGVMEQRYISQLAEQFEEFRAILGVASSKRTMHADMGRQIARNCRKKRSLFQNMVPTPLKSSIHSEPTERAEPTNRSQLSRLANSEEVFSVKDNISQFLHQQWRRGLSLKLPRKERSNVKLESIGRRRRVEEFTNPEMVSLSIPREFKEVKFNFKMLLKTKEHAQMRPRRFRTDHSEHPQRKLLFRD